MPSQVMGHCSKLAWSRGSRGGSRGAGREQEGGGTGEGAGGIMYTRHVHFMYISLFMQSQVMGHGTVS